MSNRNSIYRSNLVKALEGGLSTSFVPSSALDSQPYNLAIIDLYKCFSVELESKFWVVR